MFAGLKQTARCIQESIECEEAVQPNYEGSGEELNRNPGNEKHESNTQWEASQANRTKPKTDFQGLKINLKSYYTQIVRKKKNRNYEQSIQDSGVYLKDQIYETFVSKRAMSFKLMLYQISGEITPV